MQNGVVDFFVWCADHGFCDLNPTMHIKNRAGNGSRERVLSVQELAEVWCACGSDDFGHIIKLLLLSGFRRQEIGDLSWTEVHLGERLIKLPGERVKNKHAHAIWPSDQSLAILTRIPASETRNLVFGRGADGYGGWCAAKAPLDKRINEARARAGLEPIAHWTLHDLRCSFSTRANELGLGPPWLIEACLKHVIGGVHDTYNRADYERGKREVCERWSAHVSRLVAPQQPAIPAAA